MSYFEHASSPYPLADHEPGVPSDLLVDMSVTVQSSIVDNCKVTALRVTEAFAFLAIETTTEAVAYVHVERPVPGRIYRFEEQAGSGWVMFGPGVSTPYSLPIDASIDIDRTCLIVDEDDATGFTLTVNGFTYDMPQTLRVVADGYLRAYVASRETDGGTLPCIVIARDDDNIDETALTRDMLANPLPPIRQVGEASPDAVGNLELTLELEAGMEGDAGISTVTCDNTDVIGFVLWTLGVAGCGNNNLLEQLKFSDCGAGQAYELPFDKLLEKFASGETPCGPEALACNP